MGKNFFRRILLLLAAVAIVVLMPLAETEAMTGVSSDCASCHDFVNKPEIDVAKFTLPRYYDGSPTESLVDKSTACQKCHKAFWQSHQGATLVTVAVYGTNYGAFKSPESIYLPAGSLHQLHSDYRGVAYSTSCKTCHGVVSCNACHGTATTPVAHENHYTGTSVNPKTGNPIETPVINSAFGGNNPAPVSTTCAAVECHGTLPAPKRSNADGTDLCLNCHNTDRKTGHTEARLQVPHKTTFSGSLTFQTLLTGSYPVDCSGCHTNVLNTEHGNRGRNCNTCHKSDNGAVLEVIKTANGVEANRGCEKCHFNPAVLLQPPLGAAREEHKVFHIATQSDNLRVDGAPHANCNTCHQRTTPITMQIADGSGVSSTTLAQLAGSTEKNYSCLSCHTGGANPKAPVHEAGYKGQQMKLLDVHTSCAACHTPGSPYAAKVDTIAAALSADPAAGYSCSECHTDQASGKHQAKFASVPYGDTTAFHLKCTSCHNPTYKPTIASLKEVVKLGGSYDCSACHLASKTKGATPYYPQHQVGSDGIIGFHPQSCNSCHGVVNQAYKVNLSDLRAKLPTPGYACGDCHNGTTAPQANHSAKMLAGGENYNTTKLHPSCGTCHSSAALQPTITSLKGQGGYSCDTCHTGTMQPKHSAAMTVNGTVYGAAYDTVGYHPDCSTCHSNQNVFAAVGKLKAKNPYLCWDCHDDQVAKKPQHEAKFKPADTQPKGVVGFHPAGCNTCHNSTVSPKVAIAGNSTNGYECSICHDGTTAGQPSHSAQLAADAATSDTTNIHGSCTTCHGNTSSRIANLQTVIAELKVKVKSGATTYQCSACHGDVGARHVSSTNLASPLNIVNCSWCHSSQLMDVHLKPEVKLSKTLSCETCHGSTAPEGVKDAIALSQKDCTSCHNDEPNAAPAPHPDSQYRPKHLGIFPQFAGITGYPSPNCVNCHQEAGVVPYIDTFHMTPTQVGGKFLGCKTCHNNTTNPAYKTTVIAQSTDCSGCHQATMENQHTAFHVLNNSTTAKTAECLSCHAVPGAAAKSLLDVHKKNAASTVTCETCHAPTARAAVKTAVAANNKSCEACHSAAGHQHNVIVYETDANLAKVTCANCHATDPAAKSTELSKLHADRGFACSTCHNDKYEIQNPIIVKDGNINVPACSTCHNDALAPGMSKYPQHAGTTASHSSASGIGNYIYGGSVDCSSCHTALTNGSLALSAVHAQVSCDTCHSSTVSQVSSVITGNWSRQTVQTPYTCADCHNSLPNQHLPEHQAVSTEQVNCQNCHSFDATKAVKIPDIHVTKGCDSCHGAGAPQVVKDFVTPKLGQTNQVYNCENCHSQLPGGHNKNHNVSSYLTNSTTTECASCHAQDVAVLHSGVMNSGKTLNCNSCHGDVLSPTAPQATKTVIANNLSTNGNRAGFSCDSCHTSIAGGHKHPVGSFATSPKVDCAQCHTTDTVTKTTDLAELHAAENIGCSSCHSAKFEGTVIVRDGKVNVPTCAACHDGTKAPAAETAYPGHDAASVTTHSSASSFGTYALAGSVNCAGCHTTKNIRPVHVDVDCNKCHTSTVKEVQNVITGNWSRQTTKVLYSCADCHNPVTTAETTNHQPVHTVSNYTLAANDTENCSSCHGTKVLTDLHVGQTNQAGVTMTCDSCHNSADTKIMTLISQQARSATPTYSCDSCHTLHGDGDHSVTLPVGLTVEPSLKCAQCHDNDSATAGVTDLAGEHTRRINGATGQNYTCAICHNSSRIEVKTAIATKNKNCNACHINGWHRDLTTPHTSAYVPNPAFQCSNCHDQVLSNKSLHPDVPAGTTTVGGGPVSYKLYRGTDGVSFTELAASSTTSFTDNGLTANTRYYYQVAAVDQAGNISTKSNVAYATAVQQTTTIMNPTSAAYRNLSSNGDTAADGSFTSLSPSALTRITDGKDSAGGTNDVRVQENGSNDRWIFVRIANDAKNYTKVVLDIRASWTAQDSAGNLLIYPYQSNGTSINTAGVVNYKITNPSFSSTSGSNFTTYSIDVTAAARTMDNFGFMKFRIKPGTDGTRRDAYLSEVDYQLITGTSDSGTSTGNPGTATITGTGGDSTPPSTPASLRAQGTDSSQISLAWNASTDPAQTVNLPVQSNCLKCHDSTQANVLTAITTRQTNCSSCHTVHGDPALIHNTVFVLNPTMSCATCHQSRLDQEHLSRKSPTTGQQYTCDTCHKSDNPLVQAAITTNNTKCDACHVTRHTNIQSVHVSNYFKDTTVVCEDCHTKERAEFTGATMARHAIPGTTSLAEGGTYVSPWTKNSTVNCRDCHNATDGTYYGKMLVAAYTSSSANLCFKCHSQSTYASSGSGSNFTAHRDHTRFGCQACHSTKPHGQSDQQHFIVLKGQPNAASNNQITKFIHRNGNYSRSDCSAGCGPHRW